MTIEKAIEELQDCRNYWATMGDYDGVESSRLGIEALKQIQNIRQTIYPSIVGDLPGETKE